MKSQNLSAECIGTVAQAFCQVRRWQEKHKNGLHFLRYEDKEWDKKGGPFVEHRHDSSLHSSSDIIARKLGYRIYPVMWANDT